MPYLTFYRWENKASKAFCGIRKWYFMSWFRSLIEGFKGTWNLLGEKKIDQVILINKCSDHTYGADMHRK